MHMAVEAVICEPVSDRPFPVLRENTGKFADFRFEMAEAPRLSGVNSIDCERIPWLPKQGKLAEE
jgi:hypothetical protein